MTYIATHAALIETAPGTVLPYGDRDLCVAPARTKSFSERYRALCDRNLREGCMAYRVAMDHLHMRQQADLEAVASRLSRHVVLVGWHGPWDKHAWLHAFANGTCYLACDGQGRVGPGEWLGRVPYLSIADLRDRQRDLARRWTMAQGEQRDHLWTLWQRVFTWGRIHECRGMARFGLAHLTGDDDPAPDTRRAWQVVTSVTALLEDHLAEPRLVFANYTGMLDLFDAAVRQLE